MQIFSWMQGKLNGNKGSSKRDTKPARYNLMHETCKEEFDDWPGGLLAIGTFGNTNNLNEAEEKSQSREYPQQLTNEEMREIQKELNLLLNKQSPPDHDSAEECDKDNNLPNEEFFDVPTCLDLSSDCLTSEGCYNQLQGSSISGGKDSEMEKKNNIRKRSLSFLFRKAFQQTAKPKLSPLLKDPLPELKLEKSRLEKILRTILHKKIYPQSSTPKAPIKKCLDSKHEFENADSEDEIPDNNSDQGSKWVKTDSDFIVLEI